MRKRPEFYCRQDQIETAFQKVADNRFLPDALTNNRKGVQVVKAALSNETQVTVEYQTPSGRAFTTVKGFKGQELELKDQADKMMRPQNTKG